METIVTKYLGPTNRRSARIKATTTGGHSLTLLYNDELDREETHKPAAEALRNKMGWTGEMIAGSLPG